MRTKILRRGDLLLLAALLLISLMMMLMISALRGNAGTGSVRITLDGRELAVFSLSENRTFAVTGDGRIVEDAEGDLFDTDLVDGADYNIVVIEDGACFVRTADCRDQICVKRGRIARDGETIVCLPHRLVVEVVGGDMAEVDAVAQ